MMKDLIQKCISGGASYHIVAHRADVACERLLNCIYSNICTRSRGCMATNTYDLPPPFGLHYTWQVDFKMITKLLKRAHT